MRKYGLTIAMMVAFQTFAQGNLDITPYLERFQKNGAAELRQEVSDLAERYPDDAGVRYLQGLVMEDGTDAVRVFQGLVDRYPQSEWADDALFRVYQFYYSLGLYRTADLKWAQLQKEYPDSPHLATKSGSAKAAQQEKKADVTHAP